jgi:penicillin-binding protein-related factor A (putative recombinase)
MRESNFAKEMKVSFETAGHFYLKIPDAIPAPSIKVEQPELTSKFIDLSIKIARLKLGLSGELAAAEFWEDEKFTKYRQDTIDCRRELVELFKCLTDIRAKHEAQWPLSISGGPRFIPPKPFDAMAIWRGLPIAIEYKQHKSANGGLAFDRLAPHQRKSLLAFRESGGLSLVIINVRIARQINACYIIPIEKWVLLEKAYLPERKSLPAAKLREMDSVEWIKRGNVHVWDIESFLLKYYESMARVEAF